MLGVFKVSSTLQCMCLLRETRACERDMLVTALLHTVTVWQAYSLVMLSMELN
jgi:hypothetical protein